MQPPPGPRGLEVLGFLGQGKHGSTLDFLEHTACRYGPFSSFKLLHRRIYLADDADLIREILVTRQHSFERDTGGKLLRELLGDSVITRDEPAHKERRRILQPAFHSAQLAHYSSIMANVSQSFASAWQENAEIDIRSEMRKLTLNIVGDCLFGADFRDSTQQIAAVLQRVTRKARWLAPAFAFLEPAVNLYRRLNPAGRSLFFQKERVELHQILEPVLAAHRAAPEKNQYSMLRLLADEENVLDEMSTFLLAGHETTSSALTWTWYLLSRYPEVAARLHAELDSFSGEISLAGISQLPYTALVFQEALRLYPPALAFARRSIENMELGGYQVPAGSSIFLSPFITHRNPRYFEEPLQFRPERWEQYSGPKFAYFPFGGGAKMCIGDHFARLEGMIAIAVLAKSWKLQSVNPAPVQLGAGFLSRPEEPIQMRLNQRFSHKSSARQSSVTTASQSGLN